MSALSAEDLLGYFDTNKEKLLGDFDTLLRFKSVSTESEFVDEMHACVAWLKSYVEEMGFSTEVWEGEGHPTLFATHEKAGPDKPTVLIYNHYDVQPVDPIELWESPPFEPSTRDGKIYARGASDNKGQLFYVLSGLRALLENTGSLPVNVKLCIEGEEEAGSETLRHLLEEKKEELSADNVLVVDLGIHSLDAPAVTLGYRGIVAFTLTLTGSSTDLHSGTHGGIAKNPNHVLISMLSSLREASGKIAVPGFYDNVQTLTEEQRAQLDFHFDDNMYQGAFGATPNGGEQDFSPLESAWLRPTLEINGIAGGYYGEGFKTVIPAKAIAKFSCRLVPHQEPDRIISLVTEFLSAQVPEGMHLDVDAMGHGKALMTPMDEPGVQAAARAYSKACKISAKFIMCGGSIPIIQELADASGAAPVLFGYDLPGDNIHAPNEHFSVEQLRLGSATLGLLLQELVA